MRGDREVYTPQVVVNGSVHALGSDKAAIERAIAQSRENPATLSLPVKLSARRRPSRRDGAGAQRRCARRRKSGSAGLTKAVTVAIKRGENNGKTITYHNVARRWLKLGAWNGKANTWTVPMHDFEGEGVDSAAVFVQTGTAEKPSAMLGAALASLH